MKHILLAALLAISVAACSATPKNYGEDAGLDDHGYSNRDQDPIE